MNTPDIERAARAIRQAINAGGILEITDTDITIVAFETLAESEAFVEAAAKGGLAEFCQPTIAVAWSELQPAAKAKWAKIARAALRAGLDAVLGRKP